MMTRKNQVDDLLARFERKSITQKKCPYCQFPPEGCGKDFMAQLGFKDESMVISEHKEHFYIACTTNDTGDTINGIQERFSLDINYCPICRRRLLSENSTN